MTYISFIIYSDELARCPERTDSVLGYHGMDPAAPVRHLLSLCNETSLFSWQAATEKVIIFARVHGSIYSQTRRVTMTANRIPQAYRKNSYEIKRARTVAFRAN